MANTKKVESTENVENKEEITEVTKVETVVDTEKEDLKNQVEELKKMVEALVKQSEQKVETTTLNKVENENYESNYIEIPLNKRIKVRSLTHGGLNLRIDNKNPLRFNEFGAVKYPSYEDLQSIISNHPTLVRDGSIFIYDKDVIKSEYLDDAYAKLVDYDKMASIISLSNDEIEEIYKNMTDLQKETLLKFVLEGIAKKDSKYADLNKIDVLKRISGQDLYKLAEDYDVNVM